MLGFRDSLGLGHDLRPAILRSLHLQTTDTAKDFNSNKAGSWLVLGFSSLARAEE